MRYIATAGFVLFVAYLFWADVRKRDGRSISWVPLAWMSLAGSRWVSSWLNLSAPLPSVDAYAEGSPVDRLVFLTLIVCGVVVLYRRGISWSRLLADNAWIALYLFYCLSSILWADDPVILVKRWIKDLGNPIMALVMLTERRPYEAVATTLRRLSFLLLPFSVLFIRYYPELGRGYRADGSPMYTGVGHQKNDLGAMCMIAGMYYFWNVLRKRLRNDAAERTDLNDFLFIGMLLYLLRVSDSQTSTACLLTSVALLLMARVRVVATKPSRIVTVLVIVVPVFFVLDPLLHLRDQTLALLGRDPTLTNRTELWEAIRTHETNSLVGAGFMSFWAGDRMQAIWNALGSGINQAHNGYLEQFLNLGYIGVGFIVIIMLSAMIKIRKALDIEPSEGMLRLCFLATAALYNYTEASFYGINNVWVLFLVACIDVSGVTTAQQRVDKRQQVTAAAGHGLPEAARSRRRGQWAVAAPWSPRR